MIMNDMRGLRYLTQIYSQFSAYTKLSEFPGEPSGAIYQEFQIIVNFNIHSLYHYNIDILYYLNTATIFYEFALLDILQVLN